MNHTQTLTQQGKALNQLCTAQMCFSLINWQPLCYWMLSIRGVPSFLDCCAVFTPKLPTNVPQQMAGWQQQHFLNKEIFSQTRRCYRVCVKMSLASAVFLLSSFSCVTFFFCCCLNYQSESLWLRFSKTTATVPNRDFPVWGGEKEAGK